MKDYYNILGINSSASADEVRRAYRILARRYHPDLNPGRPAEERFKEISEAYQTLSEPGKRREFDSMFENSTRLKMESKLRGYAQTDKGQERNGSARFEERPQRRGAGAVDSASEQTKSQSVRSRIPKISTLIKPLLSRFRSHSSIAVRPSIKVSVIEVSVNIKDAILGIKKTIEINEPEGIRKVSVRLPAGIRNGSVIRMRDKDGSEELVIIARISTHPFLSIQNRGLVAEIPVSIKEAMFGATISVPTLDEPLLVKIPPGSQSGTELRLNNKGILHKDGNRGDLFIRLMVKVPEAPEAVGIKEKADQLEQYYAAPVRQGMARTLL